MIGGLCNPVRTLNSRPKLEWKCVLKMSEEMVKALLKKEK